MKKLDKLALVALVLIIVSRIAAVFSKALLTLLYGETGMKITILQSASAAVTIPFILLINIGLGIWLYVEAKKDESTPWVWCLFGFMFGLTGVAVFYLIRIYNLLKEQKNSEQGNREVREKAGENL